MRTILIAISMILAASVFTPTICFGEAPKPLQTEVHLTAFSDNQIENGKFTVRKTKGFLGTLCKLFDTESGLPVSSCGKILVGRDRIVGNLEASEFEEQPYLYALALKIRF